MRYILLILLLTPFVISAQVVNRHKSFQNIGTSGVGQYSGNTAQRPTGDLRWLRWNSDSGRIEIKINSTTWRGLLFNGEAAAGGGGISTLNTLTASTQTFATGTSGTDFGIVSSTSTHTFNIPTASASNRGLLSTTDWSTFNGKLSASDTVGRFWSLSGNTLGGTRFFGSIDNENITFISNNLIRGGLSAGGEWRLGNNNDNGTYTVQLNGRTSIFGTSGNSFVVEDDGANNSNATTVLNVSSNGLLNTIFTTPSGANTISFRDYGTTTDLFTIGADNNVGLTHLLTDAATSGNKYAYSAQNTFNPTSGTATRWAYEDASTINQTGGASGIYASFYAHPTLTAAADARAFWNTVGNNKLNTTSGVTMIATSTDNGSGAKLQVNGKVTIATTDSSGSPANMLWIDPNTKEIKKAAVPTVSLGYQVYTALLSQSGTSNPTAIVLGTNTIGTIVWTRNSVGNYTGTLSGAFTANKTWLMIQRGNSSSGYLNGWIFHNDANTINITTHDNVNSFADVFTNMSIEIRVYP